MRNLAHHLKHVVPWLIAAGIFAYLFHRYPPAQVWEALKCVNLPVFSAFAVSYFVFIFIWDSWVMKLVISKFSHAVRTGDILAARGATYLVMVLNYAASQAAFAYYLKRRYDIAIFEALGIFIFIVFIDLLWIITLALAGSFFQDYAVTGIALNRTVQIIAAAAYAFAILWISFWRHRPKRIYAIEERIGIFERICRRPVFHIFDQARPTDYLRVALLRTPIHFTIIISMFVVLKTFHADIPFTKILGNIPIVFLVGTLPITPGGLGTTNALMVELLSPYLSGPVFASGQVSPAELLFTASLLWMFANYLMKVIVGTFFLNRVSRALFRPTPEMPEERAEGEAAPVGGNY
jgi:uncharacterized membrane protein YbhN (UPF0104 family)